MQIDAVHADAFEEITGAGKGFDGGVPGEREHVAFAVQQAAGAVAFGGSGAVAAVVGHQNVGAGGEYEIDVFFHFPRQSHPPAGHLPDNGVHPQEFFHFGLGVVAVFNRSFAHAVAERREFFARQLVQGAV